jgi:hypothetical protein
MLYHVRFLIIYTYVAAQKELKNERMYNEYSINYILTDHN